MGEASLGGEEEKIGGGWMMDAISGILAQSDILSEQRQTQKPARKRSGNNGEGFDLIFREECRMLKDGSKHMNLSTKGGSYE